MNLPGDDHTEHDQDGAGPPQAVEPEIDGLDPGAAAPSVGGGPFGFDFDRAGYLLVSG